MSRALVIVLALAGCGSKAPPDPSLNPHLTEALQQAGGTPCAPAGSMAELMRAVNGDLSQLSFALFHTRGEVADRLTATADKTGALLQCIARMPDFQDSIHTSSQESFRQHLRTMADNALALRATALEFDEPGTQHWFLHLKQDCASCHASCRIHVGEAQ